MRRHVLPSLIAAASLSLVVSCSGGDADTAADSPTSSASETSSPSSSESSSSSSSGQATDVVASPPSKSWQDALEVAREDFDGKVDEIELERSEGGGLDYRVEQLSATTKHAVQLDVDSLDQVSVDTDGLGDDAAKKQAQTFETDGLIGLEEAARTARGEVDGTITKRKVEGKDTGTVIYELDVLPKGPAQGDQDREVQVDAEDGSIVKDS